MRTVAGYFTFIIYLLAITVNGKDITLESDHYKVLGLQPTCSQSSIKKAYKALALLHHPDKNASDREGAE
ncbi:hypothetical protein TrRE_jg90, partial [Triparma retinervis]